MIAAALLALAAVAPASPAGLYETHQMEVAAALELKPNGRFRFALSYGAVDEEGEGDWIADAKTVRLTSDPMPKAPTFELVRDDPAPKGELRLVLDDPRIEWSHSLQALAQAQSGEVFEISADDSGHVDLTGKRPIKAIAPEMPVYGATGQVFALSPDRGHTLVFRFHPNDLGRARFNGQSLRRDGADLLLTRYDTIFRFVKLRP